MHNYIQLLAFASKSNKPSVDPNHTEKGENPAKHI